MSDKTFSEIYKHKLVKNAVYSIDNFEVFPLVLNRIVQGKNGLSYCNAAESFTFTDAICHVEREPKEQCRNKELVKLRKLKNIFHDGVRVLDTYAKDDKLPKNRGAKIAMEKLLSFFEKFSKPDAAMKLYNAVHKVKLKSEVIIILAHHLLSQLVVSPAYIIDQRSRSSKLERCPCCREILSGTFGDTSIGSTRVWHGWLDILFGPVSIECTLSSDNVEEEVEEEEEDDIGQSSSVEIKNAKQRSGYINKRTKNQLRAQNIVFSFLQKRFHPDFEHFMVPHIGISEDRVLLYFYDCEHDILIEARQEKLFVSKEEVNMKTIVGLWLVLNYQYFCSGITEEMKTGGFTAGFLKNDHIGKKIYEEELKFGCGSSSFEHDVNIDYKDDHDFLDVETPLKKQRINLYSDCNNT